MKKTDDNLQKKSSDKDVKSSGTTKGEKLLIVSSIFIISVIGIIAAIIAFASFYAWNTFNTFTIAAHTTPEAIITTLQTAWDHQPTQTNDKKNFLILGLDTLDNRGDAPALTDTIMILSLDMSNGKISTISLPRDLWSDEYQTKINALYHYGQDRYPDNPERFTKEVIESMTDIPIHHTVVITLDQLESLIDLAGGITVPIENGFTDTEFPRTDVDVTTERDPKKLYETITFTEGTEKMSGERALKYVRSRHSEGEQGTDDARSIRQQAVIKALAISLLDYQRMIEDQSIPAHLFSYYQSEFDSQFSFIELLSSLKILYEIRDQISYEPKSLPITNSDSNGVIIHPNPSQKYQNQWVYAISDKEEFKQEIQGILE